MKPLINRLAAIAAVATIAGCALMGSARDRWEDDARQRKADYMFMEALRQKALDNSDAYFELYRRAYELDTTSTSVGQDLGFYYMALAGNDTVMAEKGFGMMKRHFDEHPDDYYSSMFYGQINERLGNSEEALRVWGIMDSIYPTKLDVTMKYAEALGSTGDTVKTRKSLGVLDRVERSTGKDVGVSSQRVRALFALGDTAAILSEIKSLIEYSPRSASSHVYAGDVYEALGEPDSAIVYYNRACEVDSTSGLAYYRRADFYRAHGDSVAFDREVFRALKQSSLDIDVKNEILTSYVRELYQDSLQRRRINELFETLLEQHPHEITVRDTYAAYLAVIDDYKDAAEQVDYALDIDPSNPDRWRTGVAFHMQAEEFDKALELGEKAVKYHPDNNMLYLMNGSNLIMIDRPKEAVAMLEKSLEVTDSLDRETRSQIVATIGDAYYKAGDKDSAFVYYDRALELDPGNLLAMNNCAYYMACEGRDLDRAEQLSMVTVREDPQNPTSLDTYAWIMFKKKDYVIARDYIDRAMQNEEEPTSELFEHAGDIYFMNGEPDDALEFWKKALELDPDSEILQRKVTHKTYFYK